MTTPKKTVCLVMIVKNEAHVILDTLRQLLTFIPLDTWSICDTGSTDNTKELITDFFQTRGIPGQIHDTEWRDFGHNRTLAFELGRAAADYAFVWDADDSIEGAFVFPKELSADWYKFMFGNRTGFRYSRCQLFNNKFQWKYVGVLHEYPACATACAPPADVTGDYYFVSGRTGARNKNPMKYHDDARILEAAYKKAVEEKDPIHCRYAFYCAQSYASANVHPKAAEYYKIVLTLPSWAQEKYMSCLNIYNHLTALGQEIEGIYYLVESFKYDRTRAECIYRLVKYYCVQGVPEIALSYYLLLQPYFEGQYLTETGRERLFANMDEYDFYLPYYMVIVGDRTKRYDIAAKMYEIIFTKKFTGTTKWWIDNLFTNMQFCMHAFPKTTAFLKLLFDYVDELRRANLCLTDAHNAILTKFIDACGPTLCQKPAQLPVRLDRPAVRVMLTMTTCKRLDLFIRTVHSILNVWTDVGAIDKFFCVDDNSSAEDRQVMRTTFPFFEYYMKSPSERGHKESMNIIWERLRSVKPTYWIHLEDDWMFFHPGSFVERGIAALEAHASKAVRQIVFNRNYGVVYNDLERTGGFPQADKIILHELNPNLPGRHSGYWPHYSLQPSITKTETILQLGDYTTIHRFFERGYADKYAAAGFKTAFFDSVHSVHIGKQHWEKEGKNAYALNEVGQFNAAPPVAAPKNEPLTGSMSDHLDQLIAKIRAKCPFGLIRPSDGEYAILMNRTLTNCDKWTFQSGGALRTQLATAIRTVDPNLYIGIPCNSCNLGWNCTEEIHQDFKDRFRVPASQITYANVFMNSNWAKWTEFLRGYAPGLYLVGSANQADSQTLEIKGVHVISPTLVNTWDTAGSAETERLYKFIETLHGELICFAAGPISKIWIPLCMKRNPTNMYVDIGASCDIFTKGATNRSYTNPTHPFSKLTCAFRKQKRNLIYFAVFFNKGYVDLLRLLLTSLTLFSKTDGLDFLVMTSEEFKPDIEGIATLLGISIKTHCMECASPHAAASARLRIFDWEPVSTYEKVLYLDTDILIQGDLLRLFQNPVEDLLYALPEGDTSHEFWGGTLFESGASATGINSGILLFRPTPTISKIFRNSLEHMELFKRESKPLPLCYEQPFLNFHSAGKHNTTLLSTCAAIYNSTPPVPHSAPTPISICHFSWPIGDAKHKYNRMAAHLNHLCLNYATLYPRSSTVAPPYERFKWGAGFIEFTPTGLKTAWGPGKYEVLDENTVYISWSRYKHLLRLKHKRYVSVRTEHLLITDGGQIIVPTKNLLYFCVFYNKDYCQLANLLLTSMRLYSSMDAFDVVVMTSPEFKEDLDTIAKQLQIDLQIHVMPYKTIFEAACARMKIFELPDIAEYKTILYLDTDIIIKGDVAPLFALQTEEKIYAISSGTIASPSFGVQFFPPSTDLSQTGFNSGTLLFPNSEKIRSTFQTAWTHAMSMAATPPYCMDQPFLNFHAIMGGLKDNSALNPFVSLYEDMDEPTNETTSVLSHFSYPIGNFAHKFRRMKEYLLGKLQMATTAPNPFVGQMYSWGPAGSIQFTADGVETTWGRGTVTQVGPNLLNVSWNGYDHVMKIEKGEYISVRTKPADFAITFGKRQGMAAAEAEAGPIPLILHTCDKYEEFWNHWYFFYKKYVSGISKVYFVCEEKAPVFSADVTVIKTGHGPWGQRLLKAFEQIPETHVFYMQEDFWAAQPFNPTEYVATFFQYGMDALRIATNSPLYSVKPVNPPLYRFNQKSGYLMTHQFSLWNKAYFASWVRPTDEPWENELEQSVAIAATDHAIYLVDLPWYEATVRRKVLQPNGKKMLETHEAEIAKSFLKNDWYSNFLVKIREHLRRDPIESFRSWKVLEFTMFTVANAEQRAAIGYEGPAPTDILEGSKLHHRFLWRRFTEIIGGSGSAVPTHIFEFGGGYGQLRKVVHEANPATPYAIYDFPELHAIQRHYLGAIPTAFYTASDDIPAGLGGAFVAFWSYTECPKEVRDALVPFFLVAKFDVLFFGLAQTFQLDNMAYLRELGAKIGYSVEFVPIDEMKSHDGQQYFCILRR